MTERSAEASSRPAGSEGSPASRQLQVAIARRPLAALSVDAVVVGLTSGEKRMPEALTVLDQRADGLVRSALDAEKFSAKVGAVTHIHVGARIASPRVVVVGLGARRPHRVR